MNQSPERDREHPIIREHPEQRRQEESGREDPTEPDEVGRPSTERRTPNSERSEPRREDVASTAGRGKSRRAKRQRPACPSPQRTTSWACPGPVSALVTSASAAAGSASAATAASLLRLVAVTAVDRPVTARLKGNRGLLTASGADHRCSC